MTGFDPSQMPPQGMPPGYGGQVPMGYGFPPPPKRGNAMAKAAAAVVGAAVIVMAGVGAKAVFFSHRSSDEESVQEADADAGSASPADTAPGASAGSGDSGSSAPAKPSSGNPEWDYTQALMNNPAVTLKDPDRLVSLGKASCRYWESVYGGSSVQEQYQRELDWFAMRKISAGDAEAIIAGAVQYLCPQYQSKVEGR